MPSLRTVGVALGVATAVVAIALLTWWVVFLLKSTDRFHDEDVQECGEPHVRCSD